MIASEDADGFGETVGESAGAATDGNTASKTANPNELTLRIFGWQPDYEIFSQL
jgi:hypothetical protein